jgi:hypothetical protein
MSVEEYIGRGPHFLLLSSPIPPPFFFQFGKAGLNCNTERRKTKRDRGKEGTLIAGWGRGKREGVDAK